MRKIKWLALFGLLFALNPLFAQTDITGKIVVDKDGQPLSGATIAIKNSKKTTVSQADGSFTINAPANAILIISFIGFETKDVKASASPLTISLSAAQNALNEVVVVGYGSKSKIDVTGSMTSLGAKDIANTPVTSFQTALQGRAAGVQVQQQNGKLGQGINIKIRGSSSVSAGNEPLYVVDGIPVISGNFSTNNAPTDALADLNMNDIASIDILKDASATAIYGSQGSNGVVLITTKKGKTGSSKIDFGYYTGIQEPTGKREFMNAQQYLDYFQLAAVGRAKKDFAAGAYATLQAAITARKTILENDFTRFSGGNTDWQTAKVNTDWEETVFQRAPISQYDLNLSGGTEKTKYYISGQYLDQTGIAVRNAYKRYNGRFNLDQQIKDWINVGINMSYARSINNRLSNDNQFSTPLQIVALSPITPIIDPRTGLPSGALDLVTGNPNTNYPVYYNPLLSVGNANYKTLVNRTLGNIYGNLNIIKGLNFRTEFGLDQLNQTEEGYNGRLTARNSGFTAAAGFGSGFYTTAQVLNLTTNNYFHYNKELGSMHLVDVTAGMSFQKSSTSTSSTAAQAFPSDAYQKLSSGATKTTASSNGYSNTLLSYFLRANYKFNDKYLLTISGRIDGSSRFGINERYGFFPAASAGWIVSRENFLSDVSWLSLLKLKASYGLNGNDRIPDFAARGLYTGTSAYGGMAGQTPSQLANPDLKWETTRGSDLGFEMSVFKNRISVEFDVYQRDTKDLLLSVEVPGTSGFSTQFRNVGQLTNKGLEVTLNTVNVNGKNFRWTSSVNFSTNKNKITNLGGQVLGTSVNKAMEGQPLGVFFAREFAGADPANGDALYYINTLKADGSRDRGTTNNYNTATDVVIGNPNPKFIYGFSNTFAFKGFDLDVLLQGFNGNQVYNGGGQFMSASGSNGYDNQTVDQLAAWKNPGDITNIPEPRYNVPNGTGISSRFISGGSYMRVKSASLGYNIPAALLTKIKIDRVRLYARAVNLFTVTKYKGWDPEVNADYQAGNINQGVDFYSVPQIKSIVFGINVSL